MNDYASYKTSKDYALLSELAKTQSVICIVDYQEDSRDVARAMYSTLHDGQEEWNVSARGTCYVMAWSLVKFIARCEAINLEFIVPEERGSENE